MSHYDLFVIGAGSGGLAASKNAAKYGKKVAIAEYSKVGGTCVIRGCVPKKIMSYAGGIADTLDDAKGYGFYIKSEFSFKEFAEKRNTEIDRLNKLHISFLEKAGVDLINGKAKIVDNHTIDVDGKTFTADHIILATGGAPTIPDIEGVDHTITSDGIWEIADLPKSMVIWGGGYIALEFASIFNALGTDVHVVIRKPHVLRGFDQQVREFTQDEMSKRGITFHTETSIEKVSLDNGIKTAHLSNGNTLEAAHVVCALGRTPLTGNIGLESVNIQLNSKKEVVVSNHLQTSSDNIYAIGDMIGRTNLTPVAIKHGRMVTTNLYGGEQKEVDDTSPTAVFTTPPIGTVGMSEEDAKEELGKGNYSVYTEDFRPMYHVLSQRTERCLMKMIVDNKTDKVVGLHMVGRDAPEIIQGFAVAVRTGLTKADFDATVAIHPSSAEEFVLMK